ncbi:hypothetical protein BV898_11506 [Hypsibius exemplaris]|uniref:Uncharacterized protein n=1 Tax=Hypsibius exemplaris TaxID=2072580 RepID=A0A1W0WGE5_HYPEX|nr:hypothetical protein BV898_11506 [Hypsibius exemplaris]
MPQAGSGLVAPSLDPSFPSSSGVATSAGVNIRQCATAPNLAGMMNINRYANLDSHSPMVMGSPPHPGSLLVGSLPMKFYPLPSKYGNLSAAVSLSQMNLSTSPPKIHVDLGQTPSFSVGPHDEQDSRPSSRADLPAPYVQTCDTPNGTPRGTPMGSPQLAARKRVASTSNMLDRKPSSGGLLGWLTRSSQSIQPEAEFFHQKEDMPSLQSMTASRSKLSLKPRPKMPSLADVNIFTPSEY